MQEFQQNDNGKGFLKNPGEEESYDDFLTDFDLAKLLVVTSKSIIWVVLLITVSLSGAFLYLRYTKPVYESSAIMAISALFPEK